MNYLQLILTVIEIVKLVEKLVPENGQGRTKLEIVRTTVEQAVGDITVVWPQIEALIAAFVKLANAVGTFKK